LIRHRSPLTLLQLNLACSSSLASNTD
jgi:hypothetical protein